MAGRSTLHGAGRCRLARLAMIASACGGDPASPPPIRFLHTFGAEETELFNATMADRGIAVDSSLVPFARGQQVIGEILRAGTSCPDLIRIDATWLLAFRAADLLRPAPESLAQLDWTPEALALVDPGPGGPGGPGGPARSGAPAGHRTVHALPQAVDGLVVVRDKSRPAPASTSIDALVAAARAARTPTSQYPLGVRVDGYWFIPWLRAEGAELAVGARPAPAPSMLGTPPASRAPSIEDAGAALALGKFAALFGDVAPPPPPAGSEAPDELRRWQAHEIAYWVTGPWQLGALADRDRLAVTALARAPRGGQLLVVPRCANHPDDGWRLARELTDVSVEAKFASGFATVPTREAALAAAPPLVHAVYQALRAAEPLPRAPATPLLFDDLNPALAAVVSRDATVEEAIEGVRRGWRRLTRSPSPTEPTRPPRDEVR